MAKRPQPLSVTLEGRFENFAPLRRDFKVVLENKTPEKIVGGVISAQWADVNKQGEKFMPDSGTTQHAFGPSPNKIIVYLESEGSCWSALLDVDGYNGATLTLLGAM